MIIWIASYPRSGNTLTTQIINQVFGVKVFEKYNSLKSNISNKPYATYAMHLGLSVFEGDWKSFYTKASKSENIYFIKTHDAPDDDAPCIYISRNGLNAVESHFFYIKKIDKIDCNFSNVLLGSYFPYLSWGAHLDAWKPLERPNTLLLKFEDLINANYNTINLISEFTGLKIINEWENKFNDHQKFHPNFFRKGKSNEFSDLYYLYKDYFSLLFGDWMKKLQYDGDWISIPSQKSIREYLSETIASNQESFREIQMLKSQIQSLNNQISIHDKQISRSFFLKCIQFLKK
jgi:hypothetical protein